MKVKNAKNSRVCPLPRALLTTWLFAAFGTTTFVGAIGASVAIGADQSTNTQPASNVTSGGGTTSSQGSPTSTSTSTPPSTSAPSLSLAAVTQAEVYQVYGAYETGGGKLVFRSEAQHGTVRRYNMLNFMPPTTTEQRAAIYEKSPCGKRGFQVISAEYAGPIDVVNVVYTCDDRCLAVREIHAKDDVTWKDKTVGVSEATPLPRNFCEALWGGLVRIQNVGND